MFLEKQAQVLGSRLGAGDFEWWDEERWAIELAQTLGGMAGITSRHTAEIALQQMNFDPLSYDFERTMKYLMVMADTKARRINKATREAVQKDIALADDSWKKTVASTGRIRQIATNEVTAWSAWGVGEAGRQKGVRFKQWVTGARARPEHEAMNGETVPLDQPFSNGKMHPGGGGDDTGCNCEMILRSSET